MLQDNAIHHTPSIYCGCAAHSVNVQVTRGRPLSSNLDLYSSSRMTNLLRWLMLCGPGSTVTKIGPQFHIRYQSCTSLCCKSTDHSYNQYHEVIHSTAYLNKIRRMSQKTESMTALREEKIRSHSTHTFSLPCTLKLPALLHN